MNAPNTTQKTDGRKKSSIDDGLRRLQARQAPGQSFTPSEIARECDVTNRAITFIERRAMFNFTKRLHAAAPKLFEEILEGRPIKELFNGLNSNPYKTGKPNVRPKIAKAKAPSNRIPGVPSMTEVVEIVDRRNTMARWGTKKALEQAKKSGRAAMSPRLESMHEVKRRTGAQNGDLVLSHIHEAREIVRKSGGCVRSAA